MTTENVFSTLATHMLEGIMFHDQVCQIYMFLGMYGYAALHEKQFIEESCNYRDLVYYYNTRHNKLLRQGEINAKDIIPTSWYEYSQHDVSPPTKQQTVKETFDKWIAWEKGTKKLLENMYSELMVLGEVADAQEISVYLDKVDKELEQAEEEELKLKTVAYDLIYIAENQ